MEQPAGKQLQGGDAEARREAARAMGSARTPAKSEAAKRRNESRKGVPLSPETKQKLSEAQRLRWEEKRAAAASAGVVEPPKEKGKPGRKPKPVDPNQPKRPRGRPVGWRKNPAAAETATTSTTEQAGTGDQGE